VMITTAMAMWNLRESWKTSAKKIYCNISHNPEP
jgi:hypothetical protein